MNDTKDKKAKKVKKKDGTMQFQRDCEIDGCFFQTEESPFVYQPDADLQEHMRTEHLDVYEQYLISKGVHPDEAAVTVADVIEQQEGANAEASLPE